MMKSIIYFIIFICLLSSSFAQKNSYSKKLRIFKFDIKEEIAPPIWRKTQKAFEQAQIQNSDIIIIHMNTYGGMLETADSIRTKILKSKIPVWVFIDNNAASAGALIAIACDSIYMRSGGSIGAATVVDGKGEPLPDKYQSYMRAIMRSTAEAKKRNPSIAEDMVGKYNKTDSNKVLSYTPTEAIKNNYCQGKAENIDEVLKNAGITNYEIIEQKLTLLDKFIGFLINPFVSGILIMIIIGGIYFEFQSPGLSFPILISIAAAILYFAPLYLEGLASHWEIIIFIVGCILLAIEIFAIPGFGITGILGIIFMITGLILGLIGNVGFDFNQVKAFVIVQAFFTVAISVFLSLAGSIYFGRKLFTTEHFGELALNTVQLSSKGYSSADLSLKQLIGKKGITYTILRPAGKVEIEDNIYDAVAENGYIEKDKNIIVIRYENMQLIVRNEVIKI